MKKNLITFPATPAHTMDRGGTDMEIKHTHPTYESAEARQEKLRDTQRVCTAIIAALRAQSVRRGA